MARDHVMRSLVLLVEYVRNRPSHGFTPRARVAAMMHIFVRCVIVGTGAWIMLLLVLR